MSSPTPNLPPVDAPWRRGTNKPEVIYCAYKDLPENLKSQLKQQTGSKYSDDKYSYSVKDYGNGDVKVFRNPKGTGNNSSAVVAAAIKDLVSEQKVTNQLLAKQLEFLEIIAKSAMKGETFKTAKEV